VKEKFKSRIPMELAMVCRPNSDDVGRMGAKVLDALAKGNVNAILITQIPVEMT
jgi:hypothetical protein